jgi:hypothetical protein
MVPSTVETNWISSTKGSAAVESATRALTDAGVAGSTSSLINVVAAAEVPCWSRAMDWLKAARWASR